MYPAFIARGLLVLRQMVVVRPQQLHTNAACLAVVKKTTAAGGVMGLGKGKKKAGKLGAMEKTELPVETDPEKLINFVCGSNIYITGEDVKMTEADCICHACWELANYQLLLGNGQAHMTQQVGHHHLCINCGRSILRASSRQVIRLHANEEEQQMATIISTWIHPRQLTSADQACLPCWLRAQRASRRQQLQIRSSIDQPLQIQEMDNPQSPDDLHSTCINCDIDIAPETGHSMSNEHENLLAIIKLWTFPRPLNPADWICDTCWELAMYQLQHTCIACGTATDEIGHHIINNVSEEENQIAAIITQWIQPRQLKPASEYPAWLWALSTGAPPRLEALDPGSKQYWLRVRAAGMRRNNKLRAMRKF